MTARRDTISSLHPSFGALLVANHVPILLFSSRSQAGEQPAQTPVNRSSGKSKKWCFNNRIRKQTRQLAPTLTLEEKETLQTYSYTASKTSPHPLRLNILCVLLCHPAAAKYPQ